MLHSQNKLDETDTPKKDIYIYIQKKQKIINLLYKIPNQLPKFTIKNLIEINDQSSGLYSTNSDIRLKTTMLKSSLCDYSDAYILVKRRITIIGVGNDPAPRQADGRNKGVIFKSCAKKCLKSYSTCEL